MDFTALTWLVPVAPVLAFFLIFAFGKRLPGQGAYIAIGSLIISFIISAGIGIQLLAHGPAENGEAGFLVARSIEWAQMGSMTFAMGYLVDPLTVAMIVMVSFVATLIVIYSIGYMSGDPRYSRFFSYMALFSGAMLGVCVADNLLLLYVCWELVGLTSYLLIGFWFERPSAMLAAKKAFMVTRVGDMGMLIGIMLLMRYMGTLNIQQLFTEGNLEKMNATILMGGWQLASAAAILIFMGSVGKSAQFPLHVWLPDAMEGPTPVSALIHAATMFAAGVFLVGRCYPLFAAGTQPNALMIVAVIGTITAVMAALIGVAQNDIKRILAFSTCSQLGFMMLGLGVGGFTAGIFHLLTHAFFKALLFLGSGSVIHGTGVQDIWQMGGLWKKMKITHWTFAVGTLALAGIFPFAGFWSKDEILLEAFLANKTIWVLGLFGAFLTAFYMMRLMAVAFWGKPRDPNVHPHESPRVMTVPLIVLAIGALLVGFVGTPWKNFIHGYINFEPPHFLGQAAHVVPGGGTVLNLALLSMGVAALGALVGYMMYGRGVPSVATIKANPIGGLVHRLLKGKFFFDEIEYTVFVRPMFAFSTLFFACDRWIVDLAVNAVGWLTLQLAILHNWVDKWFVDGSVNLIAQITKGVGWVARLLQTGRVQAYLATMVAGVIILTYFYLLK